MLLPDWFPILSLLCCLEGPAKSAVLALSPEETVLTSELPYALSCTCAHTCALTCIRLILTSHTVMHSLAHTLGFPLPHPCLFVSLASRGHTLLLSHSCGLVWQHSPLTLPSHAFPQWRTPALLFRLLPHTVPTSHCSTRSHRDSFPFLSHPSFTFAFFCFCLHVPEPILFIISQILLASNSLVTKHPHTSLALCTQALVMEPPALRDANNSLSILR